MKTTRSPYPFAGVVCQRNKAVCYPFPALRYCRPHRRFADRITFFLAQPREKSVRCMPLLFGANLSSSRHSLMNFRCSSVRTSFLRPLPRFCSHGTVDPFHCYCHSCFPPVYPFILLYTSLFFVAHFFLGVFGLGGSVLFWQIYHEGGP